MLIPPNLEDRLYRFAEQLKLACIRATGNLHVKVSNLDRQKWALPPLNSSGKLFDLELDELVNAVHWRDISMPKAILAWDQTMSILSGMGVSANSLRTHYSKALVSGSLPLIQSERTDYYTVMVQFLWLLRITQKDTTFSVSRDGCELRIGDRELSFTRRQIITSSGPKRLHLHEGRPLHRVVSLPVGKEVQVSTKTSGLYRLLVTTFPERRAELEIFFRCLVAFGEQYEQILHGLFDIEHVATKDADVDLWSEAMKLVDFSTTNPTHELWELLKEQIPRADFVAGFGTPATKIVGYTLALRAKHRRSLQRLQQKLTLNAQHDIRNDQ